MKNADRLAAVAVREAKNRVEGGWAVLSPALREALVAVEVCRIIVGNEENPGYQKAAALVEAARAQIDWDGS